MCEKKSIPTAPFASAVEAVLGVTATYVVTMFGVEVVDADNKDDPGVTDGAEDEPEGIAAEAPEGAAEDPLTKEPVPHGMFSPSGWVAWEGATMSLAESVIVKRPVQVLFAVADVVNW